MRLDDLLERVHRRLVAQAGEIRVEVVSKLIAAGTLSGPQRLQIRDFHRVHDVGAELPEFAECAEEYCLHILVQCRSVVGLVKDANPFSFQSVRCQPAGIIRLDVTLSG